MWPTAAHRLGPGMPLLACTFPTTARLRTSVTGLAEKVYPLYDELKEARGLKGVETHLSYVASKQEGYSKRNVVKYLKTAIEGYLPTVALQDLEQPERANYKKPKPRTLEEVAKDFLPEYENITTETEKEELRQMKAEIDKKLRGEGLDHERELKDDKRTCGRMRNHKT